MSTRYLVGRDAYVTTDAEYATYLVSLCATKEVIETPNVELTHRARSWALWSDGRLTTDIGLGDERATSLSADAVTLISTWRGSDSGKPQIRGGVATLIAVAKVAKRVLSAEPARHGGFQGQKVTQLLLTLTDGTTRTIYSTEVGYSEGYIYDLTDDRPAMSRPSEFAGSFETECLECGAVYTSPGHVEQGGMSCDRCK